MAQKRIRTYLLHRFDSLLTGAVTPFSKAKSLKIYATNGYLYLLGGGLVIVISLLWVLGVLAALLSRLPASLRYNLELFRNIPETVTLIALITLIYWSVYFFLKPVRFFLGELCANAFFGVANLGIAAGEWCLERRWISLLIVMTLAGFITWGTYYSVKTYERERDEAAAKQKLLDNFHSWLSQVEAFSSVSTLSENDSDNYNKLVNPLWNNDYEKVIPLSEGQRHPALILHDMLNKLYSEPPKSLTRFQEDLKRMTSEYKPPPRDISPDERRSWALIHIHMGRYYFQVFRECNKNDIKCRQAALIESNGYFKAIDDQSLPEDQLYKFAFHNGRGSVYTTIITLLSPENGPSSKLESICSTAAVCLSHALEEFQSIPGTECSFIIKRRENNIVDALARIGVIINNTQPEQVKKVLEDIGSKANLPNICQARVQNEDELANCIEYRLGILMNCANDQSTFIQEIFLTAAQAHIVNAVLRMRANDNKKADQEATAAGRYVRFAYITYPSRENAMKHKWDLIFFRSAMKYPRLQSKFTDAITSRLDEGLDNKSIFPNLEILLACIEGDYKKCQ